MRLVMMALLIVQILMYAASIKQHIGLIGVVTLLALTLLFYYRQNTAFIWIGLITVLIALTASILYWHNLKFTTMINIVLLVAVVLNYTSYTFEKTYREDVKANLRDNHLAVNSEKLAHSTKSTILAKHESSDGAESYDSIEDSLITAADLKHLPVPVRRYLEYVGVVGAPKLENFKVVFEGKMRDQGKDYFNFTSEQHNFIQRPARLFFMKADMFGTSVHGYHRYVDKKASMDIRLFGLASVVKEDGPIMDETETVTLFNDMCLLAPATLIDARIRWELIDSTQVEAFFTNGDITISATLFFNDEGQLVDFESLDRTAIAQMEKFPFRTPVRDYKNINGFNLASYGEAIWCYPDDDFVYGQFHIKSIEYNVAYRRVRPG